MQNNYASVRAVVFDAVGTLIYPRPPAAIVYYELGRQHGSRLTTAEIANVFERVLKRHAYQPRTNEQIERRRWRQIVASVFHDLEDTEPLFAQLWTHFARSSSWAVYADVADVVLGLRSRDYLVAIGSNFDDRLLAIAPELAPLDQTQATFVSSRLGFTKPSLKFFRAIEAELQLAPNQLLMIGDDLKNDVAGASQAGWHSLHLHRGATGTTKGSIQSLREITEILAK